MSDFIKIEPLDTLFFRTAKPFDAGKDSWSDSNFLPNPSVIWGAMFSVLYNEYGLTKTEDEEKLEIKNIYLYKIENKVMRLYLPAPLDIFIDDNGKNHIGKIIEVDFLSNYPLDYISIVNKDDIKPAENRFIEVINLLKNYKKGYDFSLKKEEDFFTKNYKIGIKIDSNTKTSQDNYLYRIDMTEFKKDCGFIVEYNLNHDKDFDNGILKFGGESKSAIYKKISEHNPITKRLKKIAELRDKKIKSKYIKLYFKTPTYLDDWRLAIKGLKLLSANIGKYISIGGWDMKKREPKVMKKYIPAGSVYVFEVLDNNIDLKRSIAKKIKKDLKGFNLYEILEMESIDE